MKYPISIIGLVWLCCGAPLWAGSKSGEHLSQKLQYLDGSQQVVAWVFFLDKGRCETANASTLRSLVSERSLLRRQKVRPSNSLLDYTDLPVEQSYVGELKILGVRVRHQSKWFNGVSIVATRDQIERIERLPFVDRLELVWRARREAEMTPDSPPPAEIPTSSLPKNSSLLELNYGPSLDQVRLINVPAVHNTGNYGQGVIVGVFDNGFRLLDHEVFDSLRTRIVATYDFVDHKVSVAPNNPSPGFGAHGIVTLSTLGGYKPAELIGPAFGAQFILARTENDSSETPIEEDNWLAAIEWADSIGVDVTSTSLGYLNYDLPYPSWTWQNMDGNTTLITRAGDLAAGKGIVVLNSAGNNGSNSSHNTLNAPADGDSVIAVGAATAIGTRAGFSSVGPTADGRIKPDIMAQGASVHCASPTDPHAYTYQQGTSFSCPLAAGVAALILHAKPNATPMQVRDALRSTASQSGTPDNLMGWGVINAVAAISYVIGGIGLPASFVLGNIYPNPYPAPGNPSATLGIFLPEPSQVRIGIYNTLGQEVRMLVNDQRTSGAFSIEWDGRNSSGRSVASGVYFYTMTAQGSSGRAFTDTKKLILLR